MTLWRRLHGWQLHISIVRFDIGRQDLPQIIGVHQLKPWKNITYTEGGMLEYEIVSHGDVSIAERSLYWGRHREAPPWFDLKEWTDFETYLAINEGRFGRKGKTRQEARILLFNEQLGSAYFIAWQAISP